MDINSLQQIARLGNIFGVGANQNDPSASPMIQSPQAPQIPQAPPISNMSVGGQQPAPQPSDINPLNGIAPFQPQTKMSSLYQQALSQMPQRPDASTISNADRIGATMQGAAAGTSPLGISDGHVIGFKFDPIKANGGSDAAMYKGYYQKLQDWSDQVKPLAAASAQEEKANIDMRTAHDQKVNESIKLAAEQEKERSDKERETISQQRADAYSFDKTNPNLVKVAEPGSTLKFFDPKTGQMVKDTGIPSGKLDDQDRIALQVKGRLSEIAATGSQARQTLGDREQDNQADIAARGDQSRQTKGTPSAAQTAKDETPTQQKVRQYNRARQAMLEHPEWKQYIHLDPTTANTFNIDAPNKGWFGHSGPDDATYKAIGDYIYNSPPPSVTIAKPPAGTSTPAPKDNEVRVKVADKTGKVLGTIPATQANQLDKSKYDVVP